MIGAMIKQELALLVRHGFAAAYAVVTAIYAAGAASLPDAWLAPLLAVLAWSDAVFFGFFFVGASVCLDMSQGTLRVLMASPLPPWAWIGAKAAAFGMLSIASTFIVAAAARGFSFNGLLLAASVAAGALAAGGLGMVLALFLGSVNRFMMGSLPILILLAAPALLAVPIEGVWTAVKPLYALPSASSLHLALAAFGAAKPAQGAWPWIALASSAAVAWASLGPAARAMLAKRGRS